MTDSSDKADSSHTARQHTSEMLAMLRGRQTVAPSSRPPESARPSPSSKPVPVRAAESPAPAPGGRRPPSGHRALQSVGQKLHKVQGALGGLMRQGQQLARLQRTLEELLPVQLQGRVTLVRLDPEAWVVQAESPVWATRLRFSLPALRQQLAQRLSIPVPPLKVKVAPTAGLPPPPPRRMTISEPAAELLEGTAENVADPQLGEALRRLARHARERNREG